MNSPSAKKFCANCATTKPDHPFIYCGACSRNTNVDLGNGINSDEDRRNT